MTQGFHLRLFLQRVSGVASSTAVTYALSGLTYVLAARGLGPRTFGRYSVGIAIGTIVQALFDFGLTTWLVREVASERQPQSAFRSALAKKRRLAPFLSVALGFSLLPLIGGLGGSLAIGFLVWVQWEAQSTTSQLTAQHRFAAGIVSQLIGRAAALIIVISFQSAGLTRESLPVGLLVGWATDACIGKYALSRRGVGPKVQVELWNMQKQAAPYGFTTLVSSAQQVDTPLVGLGAGAIGAGIYAAATRLLSPVSFLAGAVTQVAVPTLAKARNEPRQLRATERSVTRVALIISALPLLAAAVGIWMIPIVLGDRYGQSRWVFGVLALGAVFASLNQSVGAMVQNRGGSTAVAAISAVGLSVGLAITFVLALTSGSAAAALGYVFTQAYVLVALYIRLVSMKEDASNLAVQTAN